MIGTLFFALIAFATAEDGCLCLCDFVIHFNAKTTADACTEAFCKAQYLPCRTATSIFPTTGAISNEWEGKYSVATLDEKTFGKGCNQTDCCCFDGYLTVTQKTLTDNHTSYDFVSDVAGKCGNMKTFNSTVISEDGISVTLEFGSPLLVVHQGDSLTFYAITHDTCPGTFGYVQSGLSTGAIIGIVVGCVVGVALLIGLFLFFKKRVSYEEIK